MGIIAFWDARCALLLYNGDHVNAQSHFSCIITHHHNTNAESHNGSMKRVTLVAVVVALVLVGAKLIGWLITDSLSLLSSLVDSSFDVLMSLINFFAIRYALKPADDDHRFGHNSIEDIAGFAQFAFIAGSMLFIIIQSIGRLIEPAPVTAPETGIGIMVFSIILTSLLLVYQRVVYKKTGSLIVHADALHYLGDVLMNISIIVSLFVVGQLGWMWIDPVLAIVIALYVLWHAWEIGSRSFSHLMDEEMPDEDKEKIVAIIDKIEGILGFHELKTRYSGTKAFIQMHADIDDRLSFTAAHEIADNLEQALLEAFPDAEVIIHQDPKKMK